MKPADSFVGQPIRSLQTMLKTIAETDPSIPLVIPDGIYGQETIAAVYAFQRKYGIPMTGIVDQNTWEAIVAVYDIALIEQSPAQPLEIILDPGEIIRSGDVSPYLYITQGMLRYLSDIHTGIVKPSQNGTLDTPTEQALAGFQALAGLKPTGQLDKQTWRYLVKHFTLNANIDLPKEN